MASLLVSLLSFQVGKSRQLMSGRIPTSISTLNAASSLASDTDALALHSKLQQRASKGDDFGLAIKASLDVCSQALRLYGPGCVVTSFNGGKDAVAILHLMRAALAEHNRKIGTSHSLRVIFFEQAEEFTEVEVFVHNTLTHYGLECFLCSGMGFAAGLEKCIEQHGSLAFVLGTRTDDPNAAGQHWFTPSSDWMPPFMRVNPIFDWSFHHVWQLLREFELPFCELYCQGYTSLGKTSKTKPNPALLLTDGSYAPAWHLTDASLERAGRSGSQESSGKAVPPLQQGMNVSSLIEASSAGLLVVGDEILCGKTCDTNTYEAAKMLQRAGVSLNRVCVVPDQLEAIAKELSALSAQHDIVITSGGVGPTHDDVTIKAVALALGRQYELNEQMQAIIIDKHVLQDKPIDTEVLSKMSCLPAGTHLRNAPDQPDSWPILQCGNVFVLPGVPDFFRSKLEVITTHFVRGMALTVNRKVSLCINELEVVGILNQLVFAHGPLVRFGSYPVDQGQVCTILTLEAPESAQAEIDAALTALLAAVPPAAVVQVDAGESCN
mmetsp:Transcript_18302/g.30557  ORF Transcript_18302/g.30557 Transcript_18302/m.30557 type:complete len:551 (+) Transcript_18302:109-1761(+)|eukprot:CAMPEP_0119317614 /NCGR_PEP_ID=MMETSP1333-20130426/43701_1 /TAXON_ID=418940 /ORGANISM="Scyphosphaera apsteinii, Strain RCC1455" /LENGTH=550 /DNA_ID=CAMNT_0007323599 /DNA_START=85 /DNA_END=1737 /DNA_ORIENTATION=+